MIRNPTNTNGPKVPSSSVAVIAHVACWVAAGKTFRPEPADTPLSTGT